MPAPTAGSRSRRPASSRPPTRSILGGRAIARSLTRRRQHELIAVRILEDREFAPRLSLRRLVEFNAAAFELAIGRAHIIAGERAVEKGPDPILVTLGRE